MVLVPWPGKCLPEPCLSRRRQRTFYSRQSPICAEETPDAKGRAVVNCVVDVDAECLGVPAGRLLVVRLPPVSETQDSSRDRRKEEPSDPSQDQMHLDRFTRPDYDAKAAIRN